MLKQLESGRGKPHPAVGALFGWETIDRNNETSFICSYQETVLVFIFFKLNEFVKIVRRTVCSKALVVEFFDPSYT